MEFMRLLFAIALILGAGVRPSAGDCRVDPGQFAGPPRILAAHGYIDDARAAIDPATGKYLVAWTEGVANNHFRIMVRLHNPDGTRASAEKKLVSDAEIGTFDVAFNPVSRRFILVWTEYDYSREIESIKGIVLNSSSSVLRSEEALVEDFQIRDLQVSPLPSSDGFLLIYRPNSFSVFQSIWLQRLDGNGAKSGPRVLANLERRRIEYWSAHVDQITGRISLFWVAGTVNEKANVRYQGFSPDMQRLGSTKTIFSGYEVPLFTEHPQGLLVIEELLHSFRYHLISHDGVKIRTAIFPVQVSPGYFVQSVKLQRDPESGKLLFWFTEYLSTETEFVIRDLAQWFNAEFSPIGDPFHVSCAESEGMEMIYIPQTNSFTLLRLDRASDSMRLLTQSIKSKP